MHIHVNSSGPSLRKIRLLFLSMCTLLLIIFVWLNSLTSEEKSLAIVVIEEDKPKIAFSYKRLKEVEHLDCSPFFNGTHATIQEYIKHRATITDSFGWETLLMTCNAIMERHYFQTERLYPGEEDFPIAFARVVYTDYRFLEAELASSYTPQNFYCYALDEHSTTVFRNRMQVLASCFPNVFLADREYSMDRFGSNMTDSHLECMRKLSSYRWKYLVLLQNHDVALKTNQELVQIFKWYGGANDVGSLLAKPEIYLGADKTWNFGDLNLFNDAGSKQRKIQVEFAKSFVQVSVTRAFVDFILKELNLNPMINKIQESASVIDGFDMNKDELLLGTLNSADVLRAPGGFTQHCLSQGIETPSLTRLTYWEGVDECKSGLIRHYLCLFAVEHLPELTKTKHLFANKFMPDQEFGAISCWFEYLHNRTHLIRSLDRLNSEVYQNLPQVRFNRDRSQQGYWFNVKNFKCIL